MMDIITGVAIGIIPTFLVAITGAPAILGIIGKIYPDNDESQVRCPCSKNAALSGAPKGHPSHVPCSPRSVAEGWTRHTPLSATFPPERSGGGNKLFYGFCISPISMGS